MKKLFIIFFTAVLLLPVYAQEAELNITIENAFDENSETLVYGDRYEDEDTDFGQPEKTGGGFARQRFEIGFVGLDAGFSNDLLAFSEFFQKDILIDLNKIKNDVRDDGLNLFLGVFVRVLSIDIKNINIAGGIWDFGFFSGADGNIHFNLPKSLFTLISEGNIKQRSFSGTISASGGVFANAGLSGYAKFGNLRVGVKPALYTPLAFIPKSGINYYFNSNEKLSVTTDGEIVVYTPFIDNGELKFGFDMSLEGEYNLFSFLDVGAGLSHIPLAAAQLNKGMQLKAKFEFAPDALLSDDIEIPDLEFDSNENYSKSVKVRRPFGFDVYARYKPFSTEFLVLKPNIGFTVDTNNSEGFFNVGLDAQLNLKDIFIVNLGTGYKEAIWKQRLALALNLRAFELDLEGSLQSHDFIGSFSGQGFGLGIGLRFGW
ncbi:MAG: hypothetical protein LBI04_12605 [Treponema sp.]|jgi:hypothetical protein|nr:hypothetical protein [Treponema sp.]